MRPPTTTSAPEPEVRVASIATEQIARGTPVRLGLTCTEPLTATAADVELPLRDDSVDTTGLGVGTHVVDVRCARQLVRQLQLDVVEPTAGGSAVPVTTSVLLVFSSMALFVAMGGQGTTGRRAFRRGG